MFEENRQRVEMVHRDVEEPLDLLRVEIDRQHPVHPGGGDEVGHQLGGDRHARTVLAVLPGVAEKRHHRRDPRRARAPGGVHEDEQFHQVVVHRRAGRLDDEHVAPADVFHDAHARLAVGKDLTCASPSGMPT